MKVFGIAGASGSGKTTIAKQICEHYGVDQCTIISADNYYKDLRHLSSADRARTNFDHPESIDFELLARSLQLLKEGKTIQIPIYDFSTHTRTDDTITITPRSVIIVEGILTLHPDYLNLLYDKKIFVDTDQDLSFIRCLKRDIKERGRTMDQVIEQYQSTVKPMFDEFVAPCRERADITIKNNDYSCVIDEIVQFDIAPLIQSLSNQNNAYINNLTLFKKSNYAVNSTCETQSMRIGTL